MSGLLQYKQKLMKSWSALSISPLWSLLLFYLYIILPVNKPNESSETQQIQRAARNSICRLMSSQCTVWHRYMNQSGKQWSTLAASLVFFCIRKPVWQVQVVLLPFQLLAVSLEVNKSWVGGRKWELLSVSDSAGLWLFFESIYILAGLIYTKLDNGCL